MPSPFRTGDRVRVSPDHPWAQGAPGVIRDGWPTWPREARDADGAVTTFVLVHFDEPQHDADGAGPYASAEIDVAFLVAG